MLTAGLARASDLLQDLDVRRVLKPAPGTHGLSDADIAWLTPMLGAVPLRTCEEALEAPGDPAWALPRTFVWCREYPLFVETAGKARMDRDTAYRELPTGHLPMVTHPVETARLLVQAAAGSGLAVS